MNKEQELLIFRRSNEFYGVSAESVFGIICAQATSVGVAERAEKMHIMGSTQVLLADMTAGASTSTAKYWMILLGKGNQIKLAADEIIMKVTMGVNEELRDTDGPKFWHLHIKYT